MKSLLLIAICCLLLLVQTETMDKAAAYVLLCGAMVWLILLLRQEIRQRKALVTRRSELQARWAINIRHLNGLPLPIDTPAALYNTRDSLILETYQEHLSVEHSALLKLLLISAEKLRDINDHQLCDMLNCAERTFFALREKLRHHDSAIRRGSVVILSFQTGSGKEEVWVLVSASRPQVIADLLRSGSLRQKSVFRFARQARPKSQEQPEL